MPFHPLEESGPSLDRRIATRFLGRRRSTNPPPYSTEEAAAQTLVDRLTEESLTATMEEFDGSWYCVFWVPGGGAEGTPERLASGSGGTRALAICRAALNVPLSGSGRTLHLRVPTVGWLTADTATPVVAPEAEPIDPERSWLLPDVPERAAG